MWFTLTPRRTMLLAGAAGILFLCSADSGASVWEELTIRPRGELRQAYDDNITLANDNEKDDFVTTLLAGLDVGYEGKTQSLTLSGDIKQQLYAQESGFNNLAEALRLNFNQEFSRYDRLRVTDSFTHADEPTSFEDDFGRTAGRYSYYRNTFNTEYTRDISRQISVQGHYGNESYNASRADVKDSMLHQVGADVNFIENSATAFLVGYNFITRHITGSGTATVQVVSAGMRQFLTEQLSAYARVGVSILNDYDGRDSTAPNLVFTLTNEFNERDSGSLSYSRTSTPSSDSADIFDAWRIALSLQRQLLARLKLAVSVFYGDGEFQDRDISDQQTGLSAQLNYELSRDTVVTVGFTHLNIDSNVDTRAYDRNLFEVGLRMAF